MPFLAVLSFNFHPAVARLKISPFWSMPIRNFWENPFFLAKDRPDGWNSIYENAKLQIQFHPNGNFLLLKAHQKSQIAPFLLRTDRKKKKQNQIFTILDQKIINIS